MKLEGVVLEVTVKATLPDGKKVTLAVPKMVGDLDVTSRDVSEPMLGPLGPIAVLQPAEWHLWIDLDGRPLAVDESAGHLWTVTTEEPEHV